MVVNLDGLDVNSSSIKLEVTQLTHSFPFGTKLKGSIIKEWEIITIFCTYCTNPNLLKKARMSGVRSGVYKIVTSEAC